MLIISNQSSSAQEVTFETDELGGSQPGRKFDTTPINPRGTATLKVDVRKGDLEARARATAASAPPRCRSGRKRESRAERPAPAVTRAARSSSPPSLAAALAALSAPRRRARRTQTQQFFEQRLLADKQTSKAIKELLRSGGGFVDRGVVFRDVTGDKRDDAVVRVHSGGADGVVAVYVFSTANKKGGKLQAIFRSQKPDARVDPRAQGRRAPTAPRATSPGDELCCPSHVTESTLAWDKATRRMRVDERETFAPPPEAQAPAAPAPPEDPN